MLTREDILIRLRANKRLLHDRFGVNQIGLFGSFARGEATESSDIDIVVDLDRKDIFVRLELKDYLGHYLAGMLTWDTWKASGNWYEIQREKTWCMPKRACDISSVALFELAAGGSSKGTP